MTKMTLPMAGMPSVITESFRSVLAAHGYVLARAETLCGPPFVQVVALNDATTEAVLREAGNNTAMALWSIDETLESEESPAHSANDFAVPKNWPRCPHCGDPTATGQITCGRPTRAGRHRVDHGPGARPAQPCSVPRRGNQPSLGDRPRRGKSSPRVRRARRTGWSPSRPRTPHGSPG